MTNKKWYTLRELIDAAGGGLHSVKVDPRFTTNPEATFLPQWLGVDNYMAGSRYYKAGIQTELRNITNESYRFADESLHVKYGLEPAAEVIEYEWRMSRSDGGSFVSGELFTEAEASNRFDGYQWYEKTGRQFVRRSKWCRRKRYLKRLSL